MTEPSSDRLAEVLRLTTALSDRVLDARIMKRAVADEQVRALTNAARLLREHDVEWPPLLTQVLHELAEQVAVGQRSVPDAAAANDAVDPPIKSLSRFLSGFRREKEQSRELLKTEGSGASGRYERF